MAIRPLEVKELAEVLAVDFDDAEGIPKLKPDWRWEDEEQALLTSCSSLIATVETEDSRVVQFSHFSVKEYLTSERLATSNGDVSRYHIDLEPAHTILAQACMGILLRPDDRVEENGVVKRSPLAGYAAEHWVTHAQFERVSLFLRKAMEYLFDSDKPYFAAWLRLHDIDTYPKNPFHGYSASWTFTSGIIPLYYAALCGLRDLVEHLVIKYPQHVNTSGGRYGTPLVAALAGSHFQTARHLVHNGAHVDVRSSYGGTPLQSAAGYGDLEMVQVLLEYKADANTRTFGNHSPLHMVPLGFQFLHIPHHGPQMLADIARLLLERAADVNARSDEDSTPLHVAAECRNVAEVARVLLKHGANVGAVDHQGTTPLHAVAGASFGRGGDLEVLRMLLEHGANVRVKDNESRTPLHGAVGCGRVEVVGVLLEHGANVSAEDNQGRTPLHVAADYGNADVDEGGVGVDEGIVFVDTDEGIVEADGRRLQDERRLHYERRLQIVRVLVEHGANLGAQDEEGRTAFQIASAKGHNEMMRLLSEHGT